MHHSPSDITIIGLGLLGSSIAAGLKKHKPALVIHALDNQETIHKGKDKGLIDAGSDQPAHVIPQSRMVILCIPLSAYEQVINTILPLMEETTILTDVGSVKQWVSETVPLLLPENRRGNFVPAHPIAGSEKSGVDAASDMLFENKIVYITPTAFSNDRSVQTVTALWRLLQAQTETMEAAWHDLVYAKVSHLVQMIVSFYGCFTSRYKQQYSSPLLMPPKQDCEGYDKFTRLIHSNATMWVDIWLHNESMVTVLDEFIAQFEQTVQPIHHTGTEPVIPDALLVEPALLLPILLAKTLMDITNAAEQSYAGSGFEDVTFIYRQWEKTVAKGKGIPYTESDLPLLQLVAQQLTLLKKSLIHKDREYLYGLFSK